MRGSEHDLELIQWQRGILWLQSQTPSLGAMIQGSYIISLSSSNLVYEVGILTVTSSLDCCRSKDI